MSAITERLNTLRKQWGLPGEIVWTSIRGAQWLLAMRFVEVPERAADLLRRRVFRALRDERAKAAG